MYGKPKGTILRGIEMLAMLAILFILFGDHLTPLIASEDSLLTRYGKLSYISLFIPWFDVINFANSLNDYWLLNWLNCFSVSLTDFTGCLGCGLIRHSSMCCSRSLNYFTEIYLGELYDFSSWGYSSSLNIEQSKSDLRMSTACFTPLKG